MLRINKQIPTKSITLAITGEEKMVSYAVLEDPNLSIHLLLDCKLRYDGKIRAITILIDPAYVSINFKRLHKNESRIGGIPHAKRNTV